MKSAIILGGTAGIGRAVTDRLVGKGYRVGVIARGEDRLAEVKAAYGDKVDVAAADVADAKALEAAVERLVDIAGAPDLWINNAMATAFSPFEKMGPDEFERVVDVTLLGQVNGTRLAMKHMERGRIVCVGSGLGYRSVPLQSAYCAAKHGLNGFVSSIRSELIRQNSKLSLHLVQLPAVNTPQFDWARHRFQKNPQPAPPIFSPELAADAIWRAARDGNRELIVGRSVLKLIFGNFVLPAWLDKKMASSGADMQKSDEVDAPQEGNLYEPAAHASVSEGSYSDRAAREGLIVDGDVARKVVFFGGALAVFVLGLIIG